MIIAVLSSEAPNNARRKNTRESCGVQLHRKLVAVLQTCSFLSVTGDSAAYSPVTKAKSVLLFPISPTNKQNVWEIPRSLPSIEPACHRVCHRSHGSLSVIRRQTWYLADPQCQHQHLPEREIGQTDFQASVQFCFVEANIQLALLT